MKIPGIPYVQARGDYADADGLHYAFAWHATANTASDSAEASYATHRDDGVSAHFYVDGDSVTQALDTDRKAGHAGSAYGNNNAIAIEVTGLNSWTRQQWLDRVAWDRIAYVIAYIVRRDPDFAGWQNRRATVAEMQANPRVKANYGHNDMRLAWGSTTHTDPGPNFPWDRLISAINTALGVAGAPPSGGTMTDLDTGHTGPNGERVTLGTALARLYNQGLFGVDPAAADQFPLSMPASLERIEAVLAAVAARVEIDPAELQAIQDAARNGAAQALAAAKEAIITGVIDALPNGGGSGGGYDVEQIKTALRSVFADAGAEG